MKDITINAVPCTTWNWLKMNKDIISLEGSFVQKTIDFNNLPAGVTLSSSKNCSFDFTKISSGICNNANPKVMDNRRQDGTFVEETKNNNITYSQNYNHPVQQLIENTVTEKKYLSISGKQEKPIIINLDFDNQSIACQYIQAENGSESTVIFVMKGKTEKAILQTKVHVAENAAIHIVKVQLMDKDSMLLDDSGFFCEDNAHAKFTQIELGGLHNNSGLHVALDGYQSSFSSNVAYLCSKNQFLDMNHIVNHYGKKTECNMQVNGTLKDNAVKTYRGTIDFKNGCSGSKGNEMEESLVLSPKVVNKSLPNILCDEEDVEGEHGATIGRLSSDILFYMQSRGISEKEAEKLMSRAKIQAAADLIPDEETITMITEYLDK